MLPYKKKKEEKMKLGSLFAGIGGIEKIININYLKKI
jgi:hypothetical protein